MASRSWKTAWVFPVLAFLFLLGGNAALAQTVAGSVRGTVTDQGGARVLGATIKVEQTGTGLTRQAVTTQSGDYVVPSLPPGLYTITVNATGFQTIVRSNVQLLVNQDLTVDFTAQVGQVSQTVNVTGNPIDVQATNPTISQVIDHEQVSALPLNGRQFTQLILLAPGAASHPASQQASFTVAVGSGGLSPAVNGQRGQQNNYTIDGTLNNAIFTNTWAISPPPDAIQEFNVQSQMVDGQFSISSGANVNLVVKSGIDQFHGALWEFLRNDVLDARNYFDSPPGRRIPAYRQNQFGGSIGGPIDLPGYHGKEHHSYFFAYYEGFRSVKGISQFASVPTDAMRNGDFSAIVGPVIGQDALGRDVHQYQIFDPTTTRSVTSGVVDPMSGLTATQTGLVNDPFLGNQIPSGRLSATAQEFFSRYYPEPTLPGQFLNLHLVNRQTVISDQFGTKLDHIFGNNDTLHGGFYFSQPHQNNPAGLPALPTITANNARTANGGYTHLFSDSFLMTVRYGYVYTNYFVNYGEPAGADFVNATNSAVLNPIKNGVPLAMWAMPGRYTSTQQFAIPLGPNRNHTVTVDLAKNKGHHEISVGGLYYHIHSFDDGWGMQERFSQIQTMAPGFLTTTGDELASWLIGLPNSLFGFVGNTGADLTTNWYGGYAQDQWKVSDKLTLHVGLRYDFVAPPRWKNDEVSGFDYGTGQYLVAKPVPPQFPQANVRNTFFSPQWNGFQPRFGFAYKVTPKTVVRGAFAMFTDHNNSLVQAVQSLRLKWPYGGAVSFLANQQNILPASSACRVVGGNETCGPDTTVDTLPSWQNFNDPNGPPTVSYGANPHSQAPYSMEYNLTVERAINASTSFQVAYVGSQSRHLFLTEAVNIAPDAGTGALLTRIPFPQYSPAISYSDNVGNADYNALQVKAEKRMSNGLSFLGSYTWSKSLDNGSDPEGVVVNPYTLASNRGVSDFDLTHIGVISAIYELPLGRGKSMLGGAHGVVQGLIGGWSIGGIATLQSGSPFSIGVIGDPANVGSGAFQRANLVGDPLPPGFKRSHTAWFDTTAFAQPDFGTYGDSGRNILRFPGVHNLDLYGSKRFALTERVGLDFRAEAFNILNHPTFGPLNAASGSYYAGGSLSQTVGGPGFGQLLSASLAREIQFGLKLTW